MEDKKKQVRLSDLPRLWLRKALTTIFVWDADKDGQYSYEDAMSIADNIVKIGGLKGKAADKIFYLWVDEIACTEKEVPSYFSKPLVEQILDIWAMTNDPEKKKPWVRFWKRLFQAVDFNSDGFISFEEYLIFWKALKCDHNLARLQFDYMDTNHDGKISEKELVDAFDDFLFNTDVNDNGNRFFAPLLDF